MFQRRYFAGPAATPGRGTEAMVAKAAAPVRILRREKDTCLNIFPSRVSGQQGARYTQRGKINYRMYGLLGQGDSPSRTLAVRLNIELGHRGKVVVHPPGVSIGACPGYRISRLVRE